MFFVVTVNVLKFGLLVACHKQPRQAEQTQIRLFLMKQSDQGLPARYSEKCLVNSSPDNQCFI